MNLSTINFVRFAAALGLKMKRFYQKLLIIVANKKNLSLRLIKLMFIISKTSRVCFKKRASVGLKLNQKPISNTFHILIIDCIGLLTKLYSYADIAYVGGAMGQTGLHNILKPACFGKPVIFGNHHDKFPEAQELINAKAGFDIKNHEDLKTIYRTLEKL